MDLPEILPPDILRNDVIVKVYVQPSKLISAEYVAEAAGDKWSGTAGTYYLKNRPVVLPVLDGYYMDKDGDLWVRTCGEWLCSRNRLITLSPEAYAPFRQIRPVDEVVVEVLAEVKTEILKGGFLRDREVNIPISRNLATIAAKYGVEL